MSLNVKKLRTRVSEGANVDLIREDEQPSLFAQVENSLPVVIRRVVASRVVGKIDNK